MAYSKNDLQKILFSLPSQMRPEVLFFFLDAEKNQGHNDQFDIWLDKGNDRFTKKFVKKKQIFLSTKTFQNQSVKTKVCFQKHQKLFEQISQLLDLSFQKIQKYHPPKT